MIVVDTSALMAIVSGEPRCVPCMEVIGAEPEILISAGTIAEALIVAGRRNLLDEMTALIDRAGFVVIPVTAAAARQVGQAYSRWGKGVHPAGLNFGDCFAYVLAREHDCPLLYVGEDFGRTDVKTATS